MGNCQTCIPICGRARDDTRSQTPGVVLRGAKERSERPRTSDAPKGSDSSERLLSPKEHQNLDERREDIKREIEKELKIKEGAEKLRKVLKDQKCLLSLEEIVEKIERKLEDLYSCLQEIDKTNAKPEEKDLPAEDLGSDVDPDKAASPAPDEEVYFTAVEYAEKPPSDDSQEDVYYSLSPSSEEDEESMDLSPSASDKEQPLLSIKNFHFRSELGRGSFGKVLLAEHMSSRRLVAIKALKKSYFLEEKTFEGLMYEKEIFQTVSIAKNPFLVNLFATFQNSDHVFFVMEYASGGDLRAHFNKSMRVFTEAQAIFYSACVALGLDFLHHHKIMHRDLKLENIVLDQQGYAKITDFGLSKAGMGDTDQTYSICGTHPYMAPEILRRQSYTRVVDWWSVGVIIYELLVGKRPFQGKTREELSENIIWGRVPYPSSLSPEACSFLRCLLCRNPSQRLGAHRGDARLMSKHAFYTNIDWAKLYHRTMTPPTAPIRREEETSTTGVILSAQWSILTPLEQAVFADFDWMADETP